MPANAAVNMVSSLASLVGPVLGGVLYSWNGLRPILYVSCACFVFSAVMETFIRIPHASRGDGGSIWRVAQKDMHGACGIFSGKSLLWDASFCWCAHSICS